MHFKQHELTLGARHEQENLYAGYDSDYNCISTVPVDTIRIRGRVED
jgi:hypothetical protein